MSHLSLNQNAFTQGAVIGMLTLDPQPGTVPAQLNPSTTAATGTVTAGCAVKLVSFVGPQIIVDVTTSPSDGPVYGVIEFTKQKNTYVAGDQVNIATKGNIIHLASSAAVTRGQRVSVTNPSVSTNDPTVAADTTSGDYTLGYAVGQNSAAGLVRVAIDPGLNGASSVTVSP